MTHPILTALQNTESATAKQIAEITGLSIRKVSASLIHWQNCGKVYVIGEVSISPYRQVNLYSLVPQVSEEPAVVIHQQTWLSPIGGF